MWIRKFMAVVLATLAGIIVGVTAELVITRVEASFAKIVAAVLLSPISLSVGGGHFPVIGNTRWLFVIQGILTLPLIGSAIVYAYRSSSIGANIGLAILVAYLYFGLMHRHFAIMSI